MNRTLKAIFKKESASYLNSSVALIFIGTFLVVTFFFFFWVDKFFERNIADLRPLFHRLPLLLIFLVSALTMRSWSEEKGQGTLELLLTWPVKLSRLVFGKYLGVLALVALSLGLTFPLAITAAHFGHLDWGPVIGGYLGALLVASAYIAVGLFVSALTANQIAALFLTVLICGSLFLVGSDKLVEFAPTRLAEVLLALGTGSRFESIARGVLDVRDLVYYASLTFFFCFLNVFALAKQSWSQVPSQGLQPHQKKWILALVLIVGNLLAVNLWLYPIYSLRLDLTARREYSISKTTKNLIRNLREPLTIKFYASDTHPLLKPLIPQTRDLIKEYQVISRGRIRAEFIDPTTNVEAEKEANQEYGIKPVPFQVSGRNEAKIVNSYFNIVLVYGDQHVNLNFEDLIEVNFSGMDNLEVKLRNLEYDLTRAIKKVVYGFQGLDELFVSIPGPVKAQIVYTPKTLVQTLADVPERMRKVYDEVAKHSGGKFTYEMVDVDQDGASPSKKELSEKYEVKAFQISPFSQDTFYLHTLLHVGKDTKVIYPTGDLSEKDLRASLENALKHEASGYLKTVGLWTPPPEANPYGNPYGRNRQQEDSFNLLSQVLEVDYRIKNVDLSTGLVPKDIDVLLLVKPKNFADRELFAVDQFAMAGGTVIVIAGAYEMDIQPTGGMGVKELPNGIERLTSAYGIDINKDLVMDLQRDRFPMQVPRQVADGIVIPELRLIPYPFFIDVRREGMAKDQPALSGLEALTLNWPSSLTLNEEKVKSGKIQPLLYSSDKAWTKSKMMDVQPNFNTYPELGFAAPEKFTKAVLAAYVKGPLESYFKDKVSPLTQDKVNAQQAAVSDKDKKKGKAKAPNAAPEINKELDQVIHKSPDSARLVVIGSGEFISDRILGLSQRSGQERFRNSLVLAQNLIDWSVEDLDLLSIRSRGTFARTLKRSDGHAADIWTLADYSVALLSLVGLVVIVRFRRKGIVPLIVGGSGDHSGFRSTLKEEQAA